MGAEGQKVFDFVRSSNHDISTRKTEKKRKLVVLTLTEDCNLNCDYCFQKNKTHKFMDIQIAKNAITNEFNNSDGFDEIEIDLFGGEPMLRKSLIKELVEWTYVQEFEKPYLFFLDTNGTLVDDKFKKWLQKKKEYVIAGISLDGMPETHNKNRSGSYNKIDIDFFVNTYPNQSVRMTIHNKTKETLCEDVIHLHKLGFREVTATFAYGVDWDIENLSSILGDQLKLLSDFYLEHPEIKECSIFDMNLPSVLASKKEIKKWCGTGTSMIAYGVDGTKYPCHVFQSNTTGLSNEVSFSELDFSKVVDFCDPECASCILEQICPNCYGMNYVERGDIFKRDKGMCEIIKARALATSYLIAHKIERNNKQSSPAELYQTIKAIKKVQQLITE